jgi:predicted transcriptional regulator
MTIDATRAVYLTQTRSNHRLERELIQLLWIHDARRGLADIAAGRTHDADDAIAKIQQRRALEVQEPTNK